MNLAADCILFGGIFAILAKLWCLHLDRTGPRERMARNEGLFEGFTRQKETT